MSFELDNLIASISQPRFSKYLSNAKNKEDAYKLYVWNIKLSQSFYLELNAWEITLRNKIDTHLTLKFGGKWHVNEHFLQQIPKNLKLKIIITIENQKRHHKREPTKDNIVADLSASFWVNLIKSPNWYVLGFNKTVFAQRAISQNLEPQEFHKKCENILILRNRIAHYEPIFEKEKLLDNFKSLHLILECLCNDTHKQINQSSFFLEQFSAFKHP